MLFSFGWTPRQLFRALITLLFLPCAVRSAPNRRDSTTTYPAPISVQPSRYWEGNDGPWSSFALQVGTPPQTLKVLVSTASYQNYVIAPEGCQSGELIDCHILRGELFSNNDSSTWAPNLADPSSNIYDLDLESSLGYTGKGRYGFDDIMLGYIGGGGPTIKNQTVAAIATKSFFMGLLGLTPQPSNFSSFNSPIPSFMQNLQNLSMIPSLSWAYTAGNRYHDRDVFGSLTLGGYDASKFISNNMTWGLTPWSGLPVRLQGITSNVTDALLPNSIDILLDSTTPYIYLPAEACTLFENAFGLTWNNTAKLYLLNDTQHNALKEKNPSVTFKLGHDGSDYSTVDITLPYSAFDLTATWPLVANSTPYFPLKRAANSTQYMLGRTFFQEAYVIADYERGNFSVSQCNWNTTLPQNIVSILPPSNTTTPVAKSGLPTAAIGGIAAGGGIIVFASGLLLYFCHLKPRKQKKAAKLAASLEVLKPELDGTTVEVAKTPVYETDGRKITIVPPIEIGENGVYPIYELPAREEVAHEFADTSRIPEDSRTQGKKKRWGERRSR